MRWCFLSSSRRFCPFCGSSWKWEHFFTCHHLVRLLSSRGLSAQTFWVHIYSSRWREVFTEISHVLIAWSFSFNAIPNLVLSYDVDVFRSLLRSLSP
jgi:hypothetical protein